MKKYYDVKINMTEVEQLHELIMAHEENIADEFDKRLIDILSIAREERKRLKELRDANMIFHINRLLDNAGTMTCFSEKEKLQLANDIIRLHHIFVKSCRGEII